MNYYETINEGKLFVIEKNYEAAIESYTKAFNFYSYPAARDCYNAIELSILTQDTQKVIYFIEKAIERGVHIEDLNNKLSIENQVSSTAFKNLKAKEDSLLQAYHSRINWDIREEINRIFKEDQTLRTSYYSAKIFKKNSIRKKWEALNVQQVARLIEITRQHGFPGENLIGLDRTEMHPKISTKNFSAGMPIVILIHHYSQPNTSIDSLLYEQVKKGNLSNEHFATICDFEAEFGKNKYENFGYYGTKHQPKKLKKSALDQKRKRIGLLELDQSEQLNKTNQLTPFWKRLY